MEYSNSQIKALILDYIHSSRDRKILYKRMVDRAKIKDLAEEFDLSTAQINRIIYKGKVIIFRHFPGE